MSLRDVKCVLVFQKCEEANSCGVDALMSQEEYHNDDNDDNDDNDNLIPFEQHDELTKKNIVTRYVLDQRTANIIIDLNYEYKSKRVNVCVKDYPNVKKLRDALKRFLVKEKGIAEDHARLLAEVIDNNADMLDCGYYAYTSSTTDNGKGQKSSKSKDSNGKNKEKEKREFPAYKYSNDNKSELHEAAILSGYPVFLYYDQQHDNRMKYANAIEEATRIIKPYHKEHYPYAPYEFRDMDEVNAYVDRARKANMDSLHSQAKQIALDYCDQKDEKVELLAIDIISSYFQDKLPTTHYDIVLGGNGSGKSSYSGTFTAVGYRVVNLTDLNAANINRILGPVEIGQCTIVSDETGAIDKHPDLMSILKTGYSTSMCKTSKINDFSREPEYFYTYCFKMIVSERMPNLRDARGVLDRSFVFTTYKGRPKYDIKETLTPQGIKARQERLDKLNDFRKLMLIYRLLHFKDPMQEVDVGVDGREKELSKPVIQLYYGTKAQKKVEATLQKFLDLRAEKKEITLEPVIYPIVANLVSQSHNNEVYVKDIWDELKIKIAGISDQNKPSEYHTLEYGTIYNNTISSIIENTFGGRPKHRMNGNAYIFDPKELAHVGRSYNNTSTTIQTKLTNNTNTNTIIEESNSIIHEGYEGSKTCTEEHTTKNNNFQKQQQPQQQQKEQSQQQRQKEGGLGANQGQDQSQNNQENVNFKERVPSSEPSEPSEPSEILTEEDNRRLLQQGAYWSDSLWHCKHCKFSYDKPGMVEHLRLKV